MEAKAVKASKLGKESRLRLSALWVMLMAWILLPVSGQASESLNRQLDQLKGEVAALSEQLFKLEEAILHPADSRVSIFLSVSGGDTIELDAIELKIDGQPVASHLYTDQEYRALSEGGLQRLYVGNVALGQHEITATLTARTGSDRYVRRENQLRFHKRAGESHIQLQLTASAPDFEPQLSLKGGR
ncbi:MAG: AraC family transcriptional regulator [Marinobacter sp.]|uniref:AraC family transcriptional regulator n=1 Tax=Marinobacter sp. TaxID=50741 RepID=UPI00299DBDF8|nr:AraC family transcriptional regulator [Marinobacter sp.]MDX1754910.1 AraC family transcriptional regulator [Marinobacter sp.]